MGWKVRVEGSGLRFSAAHFTTFEGQCEPLHGHNYAVTVEVEGALTEDSWVVDFSRLRKMARRLCDELDHRSLHRVFILVPYHALHRTGPGVLVLLLCERAGDGRNREDQQS